MMPKKARKSILSRMDFNSNTEKIILLDNIIDFDVSFIREILSMNISNPRCNVLLQRGRPGSGNDEQISDRKVA